MKDQDKTKGKLVNELGEPRQRIGELEAAETERKRAEQQLRILSLVVEQSSNSIAVIDREGKVEYANPTFLQLNGLDPDEVIGKNWRSFVPPHSTLREKYPEIQETVLGRGATWRGEVITRARSGEVIWREATFFPIKDAKDEMTHIVYMSVNVTVRKRSEEALRESEERFRNIVESIPMGMHMYQLEPDGRLVFVGANPAADEILGVDNDQFVGKTIEEAFPPLAETEIPGRYRAAASSGEAWQADQVDYEEGQIKGAFEVHAFQTSPGRMVAAFVDITKRKQAEQVLLRSLEETARGQRLLLALSQASQAVQRARTPEEVYQTIGDEIAGLGYHATIFTLTDDGTHLVASYLTFRPALVRAAEKLTGLSAQNYRFPLTAGGFYERIIVHGKVVFSDPGAGPIAEALPRPARPLAKRLADVLGVGKAIYAPLKVRGETHSIMTVIGADLTEADIPAVMAFASQAAIAVENAELYQMAQQELTERKRAEEELRESQQFTQSVIAATPGMIYVFDLVERRPVYANANFLGTLGYTLEEIQLMGGTFLEKLLHPDDLAKMSTLFQRWITAQDDDILTAEWRLRDRHGKWHWFFARDMVFERGSDDVVRRTIGAAQDITERKQAEEALRESEERFRALVESSADHIFILSRDGIYLTSNNQVSHFGLEDAESLVGRHLCDVYPPELAEFYREQLKRVFATGQAMDFEHSMPEPDDSRRHLDTLYPIRRDGEVWAVGGICRDITERKQAEEEIQQRALEQKTLREVALALTTTLDRDEVIERILAQLQEVVPYDTASVQLLREGILEIVGGRGFPNPEEILGLVFDPSSSDNPNREVVRTRRPFIVDDAPTVHKAFLRHPHAPAGIRSWLGVPMLLGEHLIGMIALDKSDPGFYTPEHGRLAEAFAAQAAIAFENARLHQEVLDHAEQLEQRVQERTAELQAQYARLGAILRSTTDGIIVVDAEGSIVQANPVAQAWLTQNLSAEDAERLRDAVRKLARRAEELPEMVLELTGLDLELRAGPVAEEGAEGPRTAVVDVHDVSYLKALDRMKTVFVTNVSHELRQPVSTINSYAYLMQRTPPADERWGEYLNSLVRETNRQTELIEDIMQISRIHAGRLRVERSPMALNELSEAVVTGHRVLAQERELALEYRPLEPGPVASVDRRQVAQVLGILLGNAIRYTPEGEQVMVSTGIGEAEGRVWATVTVSDTGEGIPEEDLPHVFERFFREEEPRSTRVSETGLRLMIVKGIVELHGGRVTVESEEGMGSTFTIWLPFAGH